MVNYFKDGCRSVPSAARAGIDEETKLEHLSILQNRKIQAAQ